MPKSPRWRAICAIAAVGAALAAGCGDDAREVPTAERRAFLTLLIGRTVPEQLDACEPVDGDVPVEEVAAILAERGIAATGTVVVDRVQDERPPCDPDPTGPTDELPPVTWDELARLRDDFGWAFVSNGATHEDITGMAPAAQEEESCGSLEALADHGHVRGWGLFAYGANARDDDVQRDVVSTCFAFGREYGDGRNGRGDVGPPWLVSTRSVNGGRCHLEGRSCREVEVPNDREYDDPGSVARPMAAGADEWRIVQFYRFVDGARDEGEVRWDCTGDDWRAHWTTRPELYCLGAQLSAHDGQPGDVEAVDPATVAEAWGRVP
jgi:hypothetical protein